MKTLLVSLIGALTLAFASTGCTSIRGLAPKRTPMDPTRTHSSDGFQFRFGMPGEWYVSTSEPGLFGVGTKPLEDGTTKLAVVRYGPIGTPDGKPVPSSEIFKAFKRDIEASGKGGTLSDVKTTFKQIEHKKAECLSFQQRGTDNKPQGKLKISNDGLICLHPIKKFTFIWMGLSERAAPGKELSDLSQDKISYFDTLDFY